MKFNVDAPRGMRVIYHKTIQIHFKLPQVVESTQVHFNYAPTATPTTNAEEEKKPVVSYTYTVKLG